MRAETLYIRILIIFIIAFAFLWLIIPKDNVNIIQVGKDQCVDANHNRVCDLHELSIRGPAEHEILELPAKNMSPSVYHIPAESGSGDTLRKLQEQAVERNRLTQPYLRELNEKELEEQQKRKNLYRTSGGEIIYYGDWNWD